MSLVPSGLSSEGWAVFASFSATGCLSATGGGRLGGRLGIAAELKMGFSLFDSWFPGGK